MRFVLDFNNGCVLFCGKLLVNQLLFNPQVVVLGLSKLSIDGFWVKGVRSWEKPFSKPFSLIFIYHSIAKVAKVISIATFVNESDNIVYSYTEALSAKKPIGNFADSASLNNSSFKEFH
ncbi:MAG: hypothetical protein AAF757_19645 [Cyanobacteria bacterium P01_D01_bin.116]